MKKISAISDIPTLLITTELIDQVTTILREPFNSIDEADQTWAELKCQLWHISHFDDLPTEQSEIDKLLVIVDRVEWVKSLDDENMLSLSIISSAGQGIYLLLTNSLTIDHLQEIYNGY